MEVSKEYLERKIKEFREAGEKNQRDAIANFGAADGVEIILRELEKFNSVKSTEGE
jgi:hypothetical protein